MSQSLPVPSHGGYTQPGDPDDDFTLPVDYDEDFDVPGVPLARLVIHLYEDRDGDMAMRIDPVSVEDDEGNGMGVDGYLELLEAASNYIRDNW